MIASMCQQALHTQKNLRFRRRAVNKGSCAISSFLAGLVIKMVPGITSDGRFPYIRPGFQSPDVVGQAPVYATAFMYPEEVIESGDELLTNSYKQEAEDCINITGRHG